VLHTDASVLPRAPRARSAWNYRLDECGEARSGTRVSYWMNRLQGYEDAADAFVVSLGDQPVDPARVLARADYTHPLYTVASVAAQPRLATLGGERTVFAGAYHGWGFHEDGCRSGADAARRLGVEPGTAW
jgi:predicted NAD/FAD-binding protein